MKYVEGILSLPAKVYVFFYTLRNPRRYRAMKNHPSYLGKLDKF